MAKPSMVNTIQRVLTENEQAMVADQQAQQTVAVATQTSGLPAPPSAQIMSGVYQQQQYQAAKQQQLAKDLMAIVQQKYYTPAQAMIAQREQLAMQESAIQAQIIAKQQAAEFSMIAPRETVQNSEQSNYVSPEQMAMLEQIYAGLSPKKKVNLQKLAPMLQYNTPMRDYQGGFVDPNYDKRMRPMGKDSTSLTRF